MSALIEAKGLCKQLGDFSLRNVDITLPQGCIMGFIGENGAGKTTTLRLLLNILQADSGSVSLLGLQMPQDEIEIKQQIGVAFDESYFSPELNAKDIDRILKHIYRSWDSALYRSYLQRFSLPETKKIKDFSRGMKMKLSLASAMAHRPKLLLLDEPTGGLDPIVRSEVLDLFLEFIQDETHGILLSSHITTDLERIADYITFLHDGKILFSEQKDVLLDRYAVIKCTKEQLAALDSSLIVGSRISRFDCEALVNDRAAVARNYPDLLMDRATIDDIMLFYHQNDKGEATC